MIILSTDRQNTKYKNTRFFHLEDKKREIKHLCSQQYKMRDMLLF